MKRKIEEQLIAWKQKTADRLPLIVNGARQVGKTYILRKFGEEQFQNVVYINLETNLTIASYFNENIQPERLLRYLEASTGERIISGETLIIFDEIQSCERADLPEVFLRGDAGVPYRGGREPAWGGDQPSALLFSSR